MLECGEFRGRNFSEQKLEEVAEDLNAWISPRVEHEEPL
jgi:hypothetical protein